MNGMSASTPGQRPRDHVDVLSNIIEDLMTLVDSLRGEMADNNNINKNQRADQEKRSQDVAERYQQWKRERQERPENRVPSLADLGSKFRE